MPDHYLQRPFTDACVEYREQIAKPIFAIIGKGKELRARLDGMGITSPAGGAGPAMGAIRFPLDGDLAHVVSATQVTAMIAGLEALETALGLPVNELLPAAAFASFRG